MKCQYACMPRTTGRMIDDNYTHMYNFQLQCNQKQGARDNTFLPRQYTIYLYVMYKVY